MQLSKESLRVILYYVKYMKELLPAFGQALTIANIAWEKIKC